jgi:ureidoglycolate lyase
MITLKAEPLTRERFAAFGDVVETSRGNADAMNAARFERFDDLCKIDLANDGRIAVSIARCRTPSSLPLRVDMVERHPLGSQAFIPLSPCTMVIVVAPPEESVDSRALRAFVTNGRQGFNYHRGTWHMPLISFAAGQEYLIIDRGGKEPNCETHTLAEPILLEAD